MSHGGRRGDQYGSLDLLRAMGLKVLAGEDQMLIVNKFRPAFDPVRQVGQACAVIAREQLGQLLQVGLGGRRQFFAQRVQRR